MSDVIYLGRNLETGRSESLTRAETRENHFLLEGATGSGKSVFVASLGVQLQKQNERGEYEGVVIIDGAGDQSLFWRIEIAARQEKRRLQLVNIEDGAESLLLDPYEIAEPARLNALKLAHLTMDSLGISRELTYGRSYFHVASLVQILRAIRKEIRRGAPVTIASITKHFEKRGQKLRDAEQVRYCLEVLRSIPILKSREPRSEHDYVSFSRIHEHGDVLYEFLPSTSTSANFVAGLSLYSLIADQMARIHSGKPVRHIHVLFDEWFQSASDNLVALTAAARKFRISLYLSQNDPAQLDRVSPTLARIAASQTNFQFFWTPTETETKEYLQGYSKKVPTNLEGWSYQSDGTVTRHQRPMLLPKLAESTLQNVSGTRGCLVMVDRRKRSGHREPQLLYWEPDIGKSTYEALRDRPLPRKPAPVQPVATSTNSNQVPRDEAVEEKLRQILTEKRRREEVSA